MSQSQLSTICRGVIPEHRKESCKYNLVKFKIVIKIFYFVFKLRKTLIKIRFFWLKSFFSNDQNEPNGKNRPNWGLWVLAQSLSIKHQIIYE